MWECKTDFLMLDAMHGTQIQWPHYLIPPPHCFVAAMHALAEFGQAAHTAYKGGLGPQQARQLRSWTQQSLALRPPPGGAPGSSWTNSESAAAELFRWARMPSQLSAD